MTKTKVTIIDSVNNKRVTAILPTDITIAQLLPAIVKALGLVEQNASGTSVRYDLRLETVEGFVRLDEDQTPAEIGVQDGSTLRITPEMRAGPEWDEEILLSEAVTNIQKFFKYNGWISKKTYVTSSGDFLFYMIQTEQEHDNLHLYLWVTLNQVYLQFFVTNVQPECRLAVYKLLIDLNRNIEWDKLGEGIKESVSKSWFALRRSTRSYIQLDLLDNVIELLTMRWCADQYDQVFYRAVLPTILFKSIDEDKLNWGMLEPLILTPLITAFNRHQEEVHLVAQDPQLADLVLHYARSAA